MLPTLCARRISLAASRWVRIGDARNGSSHPDQLIASAPVLDRYCFTLNFGHATDRGVDVVIGDLVQLSGSMLVITDGGSE